MSHFVELRVWAPVAVISEGSEYHIEAESNLKLHCSLRRLAADNGSNKTLPLSVELSSSSHLTLPTVSQLLITNIDPTITITAMNTDSIETNVRYI